VSETELLIWVRGPALQIATVIFLLGVAVRLGEILMLGRKKNLAEARGSAVAGGLRTMFSRSIPMLLPVIFFILVFLSLCFSLPRTFFCSTIFLASVGHPATTIVTMIALLAVLVHRLWHPVMRFLSRFQDYLVWLVTILPLVTGYLAFHRIGLAPPTLIALHVISVELLMVIFPFTKLMHTFTLFMARYYNGAIAGHRGVNS